MIAKQTLKFWEIAQLPIIPQKTTKAIVAAYRQKFGNCSTPGLIVGGDIYPPLSTECWHS